MSFSALPPAAAAEIPASIRREGPKATDAYAEGLAFEQVLTNELASKLSDTISGSEQSGYASLIPQALTESLMAGGGTGVAREIAQAIDPALGRSTGAEAHK